MRARSAGWGSQLVCVERGEREAALVFLLSNGTQSATRSESECGAGICGVRMSGGVLS
jgi:hypothetical protein